VLVVAARELAVIVGDRVLITRGDLGRVGIADRAALILIELVAQLQLQCVHAAQELLMHLLHQTLIPGETFGIEISHFGDQRLQLLFRLRAVLHRRADLVQQVQTLIDVPFRIKRAFQRRNAPETMTAIIREDAEPLPASTPTPLRWIIRPVLVLIVCVSRGGKRS